MKKYLPTLILQASIFILPLSTLAQTSYYSDPSAPREWAEKGYNEFFDSSPREPTPVLTGDVPKLHVEEKLSTSGVSKGETSVRIKFTPPKGFDDKKRPSVNFEPGDLIRAKSTKVELEKGLTIELVALALIDRTKAGEGKEPIVWRSPISGEILSAEDAKGLPTESFFYCEGRQLATAVRSVGDKECILGRTWIYDPKTLVRLSYSKSYNPSKEPTAQVDQHDIGTYHQMPIEVTVPVTWGGMEELEYDPKTNTPVRFSQSPAHFEVATMKKGLVGSAGSVADSGMIGSYWGFRSPEKTAAFLKQYGKGKEAYLEAFTFVWPPERVDFMQYRNHDGDWMPMHGKRNGLGMIDFKGEVGVKPFKIRQFNNASRIVFEVPEIPGMAKTKEPITNLFDIKLPALTFSNSAALQYTINQSTLTHWDRIHAASVPVELLPLKFPAGSTPRDLLEKFVELSGKPVLYDEKTQTLLTPKERK